MDQQIQYPMGENRCSYQQSRSMRALPARKQTIGGIGEDRPPQRPQQAVRLGHIVEIQGIGGPEPGNDSHFLNTQHYEKSPEDIDQLGCDE